MGLILTSVELSRIEKTRCIYQQRKKYIKKEEKKTQTKIHTTHKNILRKKCNKSSIHIKFNLNSKKLNDKKKKTNPENIMFITFKNNNKKNYNWYITMIYLYEKGKTIARSAQTKKHKTHTQKKEKKYKPEEEEEKK